MINRTWFCLNKHCRHEFTMATAGEAHPPCPRCGNLHVRWVPKPVAIRSAATQKIDATVAELVGQKNMNSPRRGERMQPKINPTVVPGRTQRFAPAGAPGSGWAVDMPLDANGQLGGAYCAPAPITTTLKVSAPLGSRATASPRSATDTGAVPRFEGVHRPNSGGNR